MAHSVSEAAARAVKNSQKVKAEERTPEQILKGIRGNIAAHLAVTFSDTAWLLETYDRTHALLVQGTEIMKSGIEDREIFVKENAFLRAQYDRVHALMVQGTEAIKSGSETIEMLNKENAFLQIAALKLTPPEDVPPTIETGFGELNVR